MICTSHTSVLYSAQWGIEHCTLWCWYSEAGICEKVIFLSALAQDTACMAVEFQHITTLVKWTFPSIPPSLLSSFSYSLHILPSQSEHQLPRWWQRLESWGDCHEISLTNWNQPLQHWEPNPWKARMSVWYILSCMADHRARGHSHSSVMAGFPLSKMRLMQWQTSTLYLPYSAINGSPCSPHVCV